MTISQEIVHEQQSVGRTVRPRRSADRSSYAAGSAGLLPDWSMPSLQDPPVYVAEAGSDVCRSQRSPAQQPLGDGVPEPLQANG